MLLHKSAEASPGRQRDATVMAENTIARIFVLSFVFSMGVGLVFNYLFILA
jgi:hypothetical protein